MGRFEITDLLILMGIQTVAIFIAFATGRDIPRQKRLVFGIAMLSFLAAFLMHILAFRFLPVPEPPALRPEWHSYVVAGVWGLTTGLAVELALRPPWLVSLISGVAALIGYLAFVLLH